MAVVSLCVLPYLEGFSVSFKLGFGLCGKIKSVDLLLYWLHMHASYEVTDCGTVQRPQISIENFTFPTPPTCTPFSVHCNHTELQPLLWMGGKIRWNFSSKRGRERKLMEALPWASCSTGLCSFLVPFRTLRGYYSWVSEEWAPTATLEDFQEWRSPAAVPRAFQTPVAAHCTGVLLTGEGTQSQAFRLVDPQACWHCLHTSASQKGV